MNCLECGEKTSNNKFCNRNHYMLFRNRNDSELQKRATIGRNTVEHKRKVSIGTRRWLEDNKERMRKVSSEVITKYNEFRDSHNGLTVYEFVLFENLLFKKLNPIPGFMVNNNNGRGCFGGYYKLDFAITNVKIDIELDDSKWHNYEYDMIRDEYLKSLGWEVIRFSNKEVKDNVEEVVNKIYSIYNKLFGR